MPASYFLAEYGGITHQELQDNWEKAQELLEKAALDFQPDAIFGLFNSPWPSLALGDRTTRWPGYGLSPNGSFQYVEQEFMKAEDYEAFLRDLSDWALRTYVPRVFAKLEGLKLLPPFGLWAFGHYFLPNLATYAAPPVQEAFQALCQAIQLAAEDAARMNESVQRLAALGFPPHPLIGLHRGGAF